MGEPYRIFFARSARRELEHLPKQDIQRIVKRLQQFASQPRPPSCHKLSSTNLYRIRQGDYRILYAVDDGKRLIDIIKIGHRREVYR